MAEQVGTVLPDQDLPQGEEGRHVCLVRQLWVILCPAAPAQRPAERAASVLVPSLCPAVAHHPQAHAVLSERPHEVSAVGQQSVQVERLAVRLVEQDLVSEAKLSAHLAEPCKAVSVPGIHLFSKFFRVAFAHELNHLSPAFPERDRALNKV